MWGVSRLAGCNNIVLAFEMLLRHAKMRLKVRKSDSATLTELSVHSRKLLLLICRFFPSNVPAFYRVSDLKYIILQLGALA